MEAFWDVWWGPSPERQRGGMVRELGVAGEGGLFWVVTKGQVSGAEWGGVEDVLCRRLDGKEESDPVLSR